MLAWLYINFIHNLLNVGYVLGQVFCLSLLPVSLDRSL